MARRLMIMALALVLVGGMFSFGCKEKPAEKEPADKPPVENPA